MAKRFPFWQAELARYRVAETGCVSVTPMSIVEATSGFGKRYRSLASYTGKKVSLAEAKLR
ncbi:hypothetical protein AMTR_s05603p00006770, partial [Amborella trichopoda]